MHYVGYADNGVMFPSPLEVNRFISGYIYGFIVILFQFPSPLEVYRFISMSKQLQNIIEKAVFPSPLEVDRFIS